MIIYGFHACKAALKARSNKIRRAYVLNRKRRDFDWTGSLPQKLIHFVEENEMRKVVPQGAVHQGIAIDIEDFVYADISDLELCSQNCILAMLDGVTDPNNLGAIIRSAAAFGVHGIIITERSSCKINGAVAKASSGGLENINIYLVKNLSRTIEELKELGFWIAALTEHGKLDINQLNITGKFCFIFGAEGSGVRRLQLSKSDLTVRLPTKPSFPTLNVSNAAAIVFSRIGPDLRN
jgi:23S rRNA (guanosine2251-2'-O)-methyltransferase